jgi:transposase
MLSHRDSLILFYLFEFEQNVRNTAKQYIQNIQPGDKTKRDFHFSFLKLIGMKKILRQVTGIDVAKEELVVCQGHLYEDLSTELYAHKTFPNTSKGFESLVKWVEKPGMAGRFVMEATGVYFESFAYFLVDHGYQVSIVLPNKISNYFRTLVVKTITDRTASEAITQFGLERNLDNWEAPKGIYRKLRQLTRERGQVVETRTVAKNQLHAEKSEAYPNPSSLVRIKKLISFLDRQEAEIKEELNQLLKEDPEMKQLVVILCSLPGIGLLTAATVLAETNGFNLIRNKRQLTSYAGLDVKEKQSGTSVKGKPKISKKGNKYLRRAMHLPALAAIRHDERFKSVFARLVSKHGIKMKAVVAVQRKLLEMMFTLFKNQTIYDKNYFKKITENQDHRHL